MSDEEFDDRVGTWLRGKWKLERLIAVGGMAGVFEARHKIGRVAAIKLLRAEIAAHKGVRERFEQEAAAVNAVEHHAVVQVLDVDEDDDGTPFLVMELLEGETLADRAESAKKLKPDQLLDIVDQLLDVLIACHKKGVIHRDIKPENLFLQTNGRLKVLDFGIARVREGVRTVAGTMLGTVAFMPPEQLKGSEIDARADLFAVGATMFAVTAGRRLHQAKDDAELAMMMLTTPSPRLASVTSDAPEPLCMVVDRALAYLPKRRYPDAQTMRGDVWAARRGERPPYASACLRAGQEPDALTETDAKPKPEARDTKPERRHPSDLPSTDPQLPVFVTDMPKSPALPTTDPQMPAFVAKEAEGDPDEPPSSAEPEGRTTKGYIDVIGKAAPSDDAEQTAKAPNAPAAKTKLGIVDSAKLAELAKRADVDDNEEPPDTKDGWPRADPKPTAQKSDDDEHQSEPPVESSPPDSGPRDRTPRDSEPPNSEPPDSQPPDSDPPDSDPPDSDTVESVPPQGPAPEVDAVAVAKSQSRNYGSIIVVVLLVLGAVGYAAWYAGVFPATP